jgi:hypothetical protein
MASARMRFYTWIARWYARRKYGCDCLIWGARHRPNCPNRRPKAPLSAAQREAVLRHSAISTPRENAEGEPRTATFSCVSKGYESKVVVDLNDPQAADALAEWLRWQARYLGAITPGDRVEIRGDLRKPRPPCVVEEL